MRFDRTFAAIATLALATIPAQATTYTAGEFVTFEATVWGAAPDGANAASLLENNFDSVYPQIPQPSVGYGSYLAVGVPDAETLFGTADPNLPFSIILSSGEDVQIFLQVATSSSSYPNPYYPAAPSQLTGNYNDFYTYYITGNPLHSPGGLLAADAMALTLNIDYSDDGLLAHPAGVPFGDLVFQNLDSLVGQSVSLPESPYPFTYTSVLGADITLLEGFSVRDVLLEADLLLSGEKSFVSGFSPFDMDYLLYLANAAFNEGLLNAGAQYLAFPSAVDGGAPAVPEPSTWAMLLIGFAGLGLAGLRASRRGGGRRFPLRPTRAFDRLNRDPPGDRHDPS